ncbi:unnamed protein product [Sympodiomycopsis kandeliae]
MMGGSFNNSNHTPPDDLQDTSFESFIDADAVADATDLNRQGNNKQNSTADGQEGRSIPHLSMAAHHANRLDSNSFVASDSTTSSWTNSGHNIGTPTSLPTSLPTTPKIANDVHTGSASAGRSPIPSWRNINSFEYDNDLSFNCPYSSTNFNAEQATSTIDVDQPDLHSMPHLSYRNVNDEHRDDEMHALDFPSHAFHPQLQENVIKWTQGIPYGNNMPGMMSSTPIPAGPGGMVGPAPPMSAPFIGLQRKSFDSSQIPGFDANASAQPSLAQPHPASHHSMHGRSVSLHMPDAAHGHTAGIGPGIGLAIGTGACSSDDMLNAQASQMAFPMVKSEPTESQLPMGNLIPGSGAVNQTAKKRKVDAEPSPASKGKPKSRARDGSPTKKAPRRKSTKAQSVKEEVAAQVGSQGQSHNDDKDVSTADTTLVGDAADSQPGDSSTVGAQITGESQHCNSTDAGEVSTMDIDKAGSVDETSNDAASAAAARRKPAQRAKRPPPSASQFTESGKPFPVVDTSATHSTLFVPPDVSGLTRREARLVKNRAAAFLSRQRKREQFEELEKQVGGMSRLVWKMWHAIAGPGTKFADLEQTSLKKFIDGEGREVFDYLEQVIAAEGTSIAPTEESIANASANAMNEDGASGTPAGSEPTTSSSGTSPSEANQKASSAAKPAPTVSAAGGAQSAAKDKEIAQLRQRLEAAQQQTASLQSALAEERTKSSPSSTSGSSSPSSSLFQHYSNVGQNGDADSLAPFFPVGAAELGKQAAGGEEANSLLATSEPFFRKGRLERGGLSLTVAPGIAAEGEDADCADPDEVESESKQTQAMKGKRPGGTAAENAMENERSQMEVNQGQRGELESMVNLMGMNTVPAGSGTVKKPSGGLALMALMVGLAVAGGHHTTGTQMPNLNLAYNAHDFGGSALPNALFTSGGGPSDFIGKLADSFQRMGEDEEGEEGLNGAMKAIENGWAPSSHLSEADLALEHVSVDADAANGLPLIQ